jgi:hypothetical protein
MRSRGSGAGGLGQPGHRVGFGAKRAFDLGLLCSSEMGPRRPLAEECGEEFASCERDLNLMLAQHLVSEELEMVSPVPPRLPTAGPGYIHQRHLQRVH